ncbi:TPA: tyrosine-type recombinase/integrase [Vibrio parahaemolyticus]|uniref:tyrosine-type recombinase/integrase n=1 Tax=Vibrio harveyi group TaxID=717610 RepID=UPI000945C379|nr:site-specific integrase [Vibrio parahaemolyticus]QLK47562.1 site-specific integrase [Vibrio owensii]EJE4150082.1 tyrosine-type recombinase/integrase [Vibrio parahaemolyticus]MBE4173526.1 tyrosine-type recombinase/integrase [Vibrio parahaemolyticus]MBY7719219.1 tyrosine-type recombinase/integrase [Vibrio parahaemolyticus]MCR9758552.1 tyrosine-type recombinase/integrase [Vibrio parahaemolyticus]
MSKSQRLTTAFLNNLKPNPANAKSTDYEVNLSAMKDSGLPTGVRCLVGKSGNKRFLLRYVSPVTGKKASIGLGKHPETDILTLRKIAKEYRQQILEGIDPKIERDTEKVDSSMTLERFFNEVYLPLAKQKRSWKDEVARFRHAKSIHHVSIHDLTAAHIIKIQMEMQEAISKTTGKPYATASINRVLALLKTINRQAYKLMDAPLVADKVSLMKEDNVRTGYLSEVQLKDFVRYALEYPDRHTGAFLALLFLTGLRDKELRFRLWNDINWEEQTLTIPHTKNGSSHVIYLSDYMVTILKSIPQVTNSPFIFAGRRKGKPISPARHALRVIKEKMGLPDVPGDKANITLHSARHTVGSLLASRGVPLHDIAKQLNHADLSSTRRYSKLTIGRRREIGSHLSDMVSGHVSVG